MNNSALSEYMEHLHTHPEETLDAHYFNSLHEAEWMYPHVERLMDIEKS